MRLIPAILTDELWFPDARKALRGRSFNGLVAIGGDLSPARLLLAYRHGIFPWTVSPLTWWSPDPRTIIEFEQFHVSRSLQKVWRKEVFQITVNAAFHRVMEECAAPAPGRETTWISPEFIDAYSKLHTLGYAHSLECWKEGQLAGGIYGVAVGGLFAGESMFHRAANASKIALTALVQRLAERGFGLLDVQMETPLTKAMGARSISRDEYLNRLEIAVKLPCTFT